MPFQTSYKLCKRRIWHCCRFTIAVFNPSAAVQMAALCSNWAIHFIFCFLYHIKQLNLKYTCYFQYVNWTFIDWMEESINHHGDFHNRLREITQVVWAPHFHSWMKYFHPSLIYLHCSWVLTIIHQWNTLSDHHDGSHERSLIIHLEDLHIGLKAITEVMCIPLLSLYTTFIFQYSLSNKWWLEEPRTLSVWCFYWSLSE